MTSIRIRTVKTPAVICALLLALLGLSSAYAYQTWSDDPLTDTGNCATCHGKYGFVGTKYVSLHDATTWTGDLMTGHGSTTMTGCMECHLVEGDQPSIVRCTGCHGREEDGGIMQKGVGLRQRHRLKEVTECEMCHGASEVTVGENVVPATMIIKGIDPCNDAQFGSDGLDNDGDGLYDSADPDCQKGEDAEDGVAE